MATETRRARLVESASSLREAVGELRTDGARIGFVPTMGWLHEGHLSLVDRAREAADAVVLSVFVNPTQFGPDEDFEEYPRDLDRDLRLAAERGVDLVFAPPVSEMYPREQSIWVVPGPLGDRLCGASRPGHFRGVLTVVIKLLHLVDPDAAVFGRKDFQQAVLVRRMVEELTMDVEVLTAPIVRDADGLALSSRNEYLSASERDAALSLSRGLREVRRAFREGERDGEALARLARRTMEEAGARVDYAEVVDPETLEPAAEASEESVCAVAAYVGDTRLIDNAPVGAPCSLA